MQIRPSFIMNFFAGLFLLVAIELEANAALALSLVCFGLAIIAAIDGD